jgi:hypothetical protein
MNEQLIVEIVAVIAALKYPGAILAVLVYAMSSILGGKDPKGDAKEVKDMFK